MTVVTVCQLGLTVGEVEANRAAAQAAGDGAELVVLPELCDSGYVFHGAAEARALATPATHSPTLREWQALALRYATTIAGPPGHRGPGGRSHRPCDLARARNKKIREHNDVLADRRPPLYRAVAG